MVIEKYLIKKENKSDFKSAYEIGEERLPLRIFIGHHNDDTFGIGIFEKGKEGFREHFVMTRQEFEELAFVVKNQLVE